MALKPAGVKIYFQPLRKDLIGRIRIMQPDGKSLWTYTASFKSQEHSKWADVPCCFAEEGMTQEQVIEAMIEYDERCGYPPAELIGEL